MTEFQAGILLEQLTRLEQQSRKREENAHDLTDLLSEIPGIRPARMYAGCTRNAYHLYMFRYDAATFGGLPRAKFLKALEAEGIPCSPGYRPLNREPFLTGTLESRAFRECTRTRIAAPGATGTSVRRTTVFVKKRSGSHRRCYRAPTRYGRNRRGH